jgi:hypothetical protein
MSNEGAFNIIPSVISLRLFPGSCDLQAGLNEVGEMLCIQWSNPCFARSGRFFVLKPNGLGYGPQLVRAIYEVMSHLAD